MTMMFAAVVLFAGCLAMTMTGTVANGMTECTVIDCIQPYVWSTTTVNCTEETKKRTGDCRWPSGMNSRMDELVYGGRIAAYQIQWFSGAWSNWFVPGMNDMDAKYNTLAITCSLPYPRNGLRKAWSYFFDHTHKIIICR